jgi:hypothetical protein
MLTIEGLNSLTGEECFECKSKKHDLLTCEQCVFNVSLGIKKDWYHKRGLQQGRRNGGNFRNHQRVTEFMRDPVTSKKINKLTRPDKEDHRVS